MKMTNYKYVTDLDERGGYRAHVETPRGRCVYTVLAGDELGEDETSIFEDGFMRNRDDMRGLQTYLIELGIIGGVSTITQA